MIYEKIVDLAKRRNIFWPAFEIYGGLSGFYDYGHIGTKIKDNVINQFKYLFINIEGMAIIDSPNINMEEVLEASGHTKVFTDYISYCKVCGEAYRVDEYIKQFDPKFEFTGYDAMVKKMKELNLKCKKCGGDLTEPEKFNLMLSTKVGPGKGKICYLRPETAQGIFINFLNYYRFFREKIPFGVVQVGKGFRNEIAPRQTLIRLREFNMAEVEVFLDPFDLNWNGKIDVWNDDVNLLPNNGQEVKIKLKEAHDKKIIKLQPIAYFIGLVNRFMINIGIDSNKIRFRQHNPDELAHYSKDCWDCEILTDNGWIEVVGIADRDQYDLKQHSEYSKVPLVFKRKLETPIKIKKKKYKPNEDKLKEYYKNEWKNVYEFLLNAEVKDTVPLYKGIPVCDGCYDIEEYEEFVYTEDIIPAVVEPSFGIDRIILSLLEHSYYEREDKNYKVLRLKPHIAPFKVAIFPLMPKDNLDKLAYDIYLKASGMGIDCYYDESGSIGKRYARADEIGTPWAITIDYQTLNDNTVTLRDRDTTKQIRMHYEEALKYILESVEKWKREKLLN
ncbi:MAG: glycine--tRNA ligase [Thermoplasmata archaeon]